MSVSPNSEELRFSQPDWFSQHIPNLEKWLEPYKDKPQTLALEIGACEGRSTLWMLENILTHDESIMITVDPFVAEAMPDAGIEQHLSIQIYENFLHNTEKYSSQKLIHTEKYSDGHKLIHRRQTSNMFLLDWLQRYQNEIDLRPFEIIYIDGSHMAVDVLTDIVLSWELLASGGTMILDDYEWNGGARAQERPRMAIDAFLGIYLGQYDVLGVGIQVAVRKR